MPQAGWPPDPSFCVGAYLTDEMRLLRVERVLRVGHFPTARTMVLVEDCFTGLADELTERAVTKLRLVTPAVAPSASS